MPVFSKPPLPIASGPPAPQLIQHITWNANNAAFGITGNNFKGTLPNPVGQGNAIRVAITYPNGSTPTVTDNNGNTWPGSPNGGIADNGVDNYVSAVFVLLNAKAGMTTITVGFGGLILPFQFEIDEWYNVGAVAVGHTAAGVAAPNLLCGSFTPSNNDGNGGNLIVSYFCLSQIAASTPNLFTPSTNFKLLNADILWPDASEFWHASAYYVQTAHQAINPGMTAAGDTQGYNCVATVLQAAAVGTPRPAGLRIIKIIHMSRGGLPASGTDVIQCPSEGNLRVLMNASGQQITITNTGVTDSEGNTWNARNPNPGDGSPYVFDFPGSSINQSLTVSIAYTNKSTAGMSWRYFDIVGASASPFDSIATFPAFNFSGTTLDDAPTHTPSSSNVGLVLATLGLGIGPVTAFDTGAPAGAVMDNITYSGQTDNDLMDNADGVAHVYGTGTTTLNWNWVNAGNTTGYATSVAYKHA